MRQQGFKAELPNWGNAIYDYNSFKIAGKEALEGTMVDQVYAMFLGEDAKFAPEVNTFLEWMKRTDPNQTVDLFAFYGWLSSKLWAEAMRTMGPQATRPKLIETLAKKGVWDADGLVAPFNVGQERPSDCVFIFKITDGKFVRVHPTDKPYDCNLGPFISR
jgi:hypothetical protein